MLQQPLLLDVGIKCSSSGAAPDTLLHRCREQAGKQFGAWAEGPPSAAAHMLSLLAHVAQVEVRCCAVHAVHAGERLLAGLCRPAPAARLGLLTPPPPLRTPVYLPTGGAVAAGRGARIVDGGRAPGGRHDLGQNAGLLLGHGLPPGPKALPPGCASHPPAACAAARLCLPPATPGVRGSRPLPPVSLPLCLSASHPALTCLPRFGPPLVSLHHPCRPGRPHLLPDAAAHRAARRQHHLPGQDVPARHRCAPVALFCQLLARAGCVWLGWAR